MTSNTTTKRIWLESLKTIPKISEDDWKKSGLITKWLIATRSAIFIITILSAAIAGIVAYKNDLFELSRWVLLTLGLIFAHATNNLINDLTDYLKGVDTKDYYRSQYGPQPLTHGLMTIKQSIIYIVITGLAAVSFGAYLVITSGTYGYILFAIGAFFVLFYTYPLKYIGLGEVAVFLVWGPLMVGGGYFVITGQFTTDVLITALPYALGTTGVIFGKHIDKLAMDKKKRIYTLPVILGEKFSRICLFLFSIAPYLCVIAMVLFYNFSPILLIVFLAFKGLLVSARESLKPPPEKTPDWFPKELWPHWYVAIAFYNNRQFGIFFFIGLLIDALLKRGII